jgi:hypothetical protein
MKKEATLKKQSTVPLKGGARAPREAGFGNQMIEDDGHAFSV